MKFFPFELNNVFHFSGAMTSFVWKLFDIQANDVTKAVCKVCDKIISRGGNRVKSMTTTWHNHAKNAHRSDRVQPGTKG